MATTFQPAQCVLCGHYLTLIEEYGRKRCTDPAHWLAAGRLASQDFYAMARIAAMAQQEALPPPPISRFRSC